MTIVCLFTPKLYIILLHPEKNIRQSLMNTNKYQSVKISAHTGAAAAPGANGSVIRQHSNTAVMPPPPALTTGTGSAGGGRGTTSLVAGVTASTANAAIMPGKKLTLSVQNGMVKSRVKTIYLN